MPRARQARVMAVLALAMVGTVPIVGAFPASSQASTGASCSSGWTVTSPPTTGSLHAITQTAPVAGGNLYAVGYSLDVAHNVDQPAAETWNGTSWSTAPVQSVTTNDSELNAVSMTGTGNGWAVGWDAATGALSYRTLAEQWNGSAWNAVSTPDPGAGNNLLLGVDALTRQDVWAVGYGAAGPGGARQTLAEQWNGSAWSLAATPDVGTGDNTLLGVAASGPSDVWAVGYDTSAAGYASLIEHYDGTGWSVVATPVAGLADNVLTAVSATGPSDVWAVGYQTTPGGQYHSLVEHWDGSTWSIVTPPALGASIDVLRSVEAHTANDAWAVGTYLDPVSGQYQGLTLHWDGSIWSPVVFPIAATGATQLRGVVRVPGTDRWWAEGLVTIGGGVTTPLAAESCAAPPAGLATRASSSPFPRAGSLSSSIRTTAADRGFRGPDRRSMRSGPDLIGPKRTSPTSPGSAAPVTAYDEAASAGLGLTSASPSAVVADFGNGAPDVFESGYLADFTGAPGVLYLNDGAGHFTSTDSTEFPVADRRSCDAGDVFGDGRTDIVCSVGAQNGNYMKLDNLFMEASGSGITFSDQAVSLGLADPFARGGSVTFVRNPDGREDLFVGASPTRSDGLPDPNRFFVNTGSGFQDTPAYGLDQQVGASCASDGDVNGDGYDDLLVCTQLGLKLYENQAGHGFSDVTAAVGLPAANAKDAILADLNGDGRLDIAVVTRGALEVFLQSPTHSFSLSYSLPLPDPTSLAAGDVNGDGIDDLLVVQGGGQPDVMLLNNGTGTGFSQLPIPEPASGQGTAAHPIDYAGNGLSDFVVFHSGGGGTGPVELLVFFPDTRPKITLQPLPATVTAGATATFSAGASGVPAPTVQWEFSKGPGQGWVKIAGATATTYATVVTSAQATWRWRAEFTNLLGSVGTRAVGVTVQ